MRESRILSCYFGVLIVFVLVSFMSQPAWAAVTVSWQFSGYGLNDGGPLATVRPTVQFTVTDSSLAGNGNSDTISVLVNSTSDPTGITLKLKETGDTGVFKNTNLIFANGTGEFSTSDTTTVSITDPTRVTNPSIVESIVSGPSPGANGIEVLSTSTSYPGIYLNLTETGSGTGVFTNNLHFTTSSSVNGSSIHVSDGDIVSIEYLKSLRIQNELIIPNPDAALGVIPAKYGDTVDAIYNEVKASTTIDASADPGGGGGGLVRPGLILDALAAIGVSENVFNPPSLGNDYHNPYGGGITINGKPFDVKNYSTTIQQQVLNIGRPVIFGLKIYDERGAYTVSHAGMYFHFKGDAAVNNADTWISWDKHKGLDLHDPNKIFSKTAVDTKADGNFFDVTFTMVPKRTMPDSSLIFRMWDDKNVVSDVPIWGAIVIVDPNAPVPVKKVPENQYGDYLTLEKILDQDGYYIPTLLNKMHSFPDIYTSLEINWVYDKGISKLTMVENDKSGSLLGAITCNLTKKISQPTVTDHDYFMFTTQQLNRQNETQEDLAKMSEAQKAVKLLESLNLVRQNNFASWPLQN